MMPYEILFSTRLNTWAFHGENTDAYFFNNSDGDRCWRYANETSVGYTGKGRNRMKMIKRIAFKSMLESDYLDVVGVPEERHAIMKQRIFIGDTNELMLLFKEGEGVAEAIETG